MVEYARPQPVSLTSGRDRLPVEDSLLPESSLILLPVQRQVRERLFHRPFHFRGFASGPATGGDTCPLTGRCWPGQRHRILPQPPAHSCHCEAEEALSAS